MIFFLLFLLALLFAILEDAKSIYIDPLKCRNRNLFWGSKVLALLMFLLCALRGIDVGIDTSHYFDSFNAGVSRYIEVGYWIIRRVSIWCGNSFQIFITLFACASLLPLYKMLKRTSVNVSFSLLIYLSFSNYYYPEVFNTIRATSAIAFFVLALSYWDVESYRKSLSLFVIACLFHVSALIATAVVLCVTVIKKIPRTICYITVIASMVFGFVFQTGFSEYSYSLSLWLGNISGDFTDYYSKHLMELNETDFNSIGTLANMLPFTLFSLFLYDEKNSTSCFYKLFVIGTALSNIFISISLIYRITMFFTILLIVVLPNTLKRLKQTPKYIVKVLILFMLLWYIYKLFGTSSDNMAGIIPYKFFFE